MTGFGGASKQKLIDHQATPTVIISYSSRINAALDRQ